MLLLIVGLVTFLIGIAAGIVIGMVYVAANAFRR